MDPKLTMALLAADVIHCLPFLGKIQMLQDVTDDDLLSAGIRLREDRNRILKVFTDFKESIKPSAPLEEGASAPAFESLSTVCNECSICMDQEVNVHGRIFDLRTKATFFSVVHDFHTLRSSLLL